MSHRSVLSSLQKVRRREKDHPEGGFTFLRDMLEDDRNILSVPMFRMSEKMD
jgi:hypothetical protein